MSLKRSAFFNGNYYQAAEYQQKLNNIMPVKRATDWMALGSYTLMNGLNSKALTFFNKASEIDSSDHVVKFNLALYYTITGEPQKAKEILLTNFSTAKGAGTQGETRILLADILAKSEKKSDKETAEKYYQEAVNYYGRQIQANSSSPSAYMWIGRAYLGLNEIDKAINNLLIAQFIESRPFYMGMIDLWLGKAYVVAGDKKLAEENLTSVISSTSAVYHQKEAKDILKQLKK